MNEDIKLEYMHLCDYASQANAGKINLLGIFDNFLLTPMTPDFYIAAKISVNKKITYTVSFEIKSKIDGSKIFVDPNPIIVPENRATLNFNILKLIKNVQFKNVGDCILTILVNDLPIGYKEVGVKPLN